MSQELSRRQMAAVVAAGGLLASALPAKAYQGNMERALGSLRDALDLLRDATANKGGHRERAIELIRGAIAEVKAGIDFAAEHGGNGL